MAHKRSNEFMIVLFIAKNNKNNNAILINNNSNLINNSIQFYIRPFQNSPGHS